VSNKIDKTINKTDENPDDKLTFEQMKQKQTLLYVNNTEFISDTFQTSDKDLEEVKAGMKILGLDTLALDAVESNFF